MDAEKLWVEMAELRKREVHMIDQIAEYFKSINERLDALLIRARCNSNKLAELTQVIADGRKSMDRRLKHLEAELPLRIEGDEHERCAVDADQAIREGQSP